MNNETPAPNISTIPASNQKKAPRITDILLIVAGFALIILVGVVSFSYFNKSSSSTDNTEHEAEIAINVFEQLSKDDAMDFLGKHFRYVPAGMVDSKIMINSKQWAYTVFESYTDNNYFQSQKFIDDVNESDMKLCLTNKRPAAVMKIEKINDIYSLVNFNSKDITNTNLCTLGVVFNSDYVWYRTQFESDDYMGHYIVLINFKKLDKATVEKALKAFVATYTDISSFCSYNYAFQETDNDYRLRLNMISADYNRSTSSKSGKSGYVLVLYSRTWKVDKTTGKFEEITGDDWWNDGSPVRYLSLSDEEYYALMEKAYKEDYPDYRN